jgi:hypothetical protein
MTGKRHTLAIDHSPQTAPWRVLVLAAIMVAIWTAGIALGLG